MAADILLYDIDTVPVGKDQKQHVEIARDVAGKFNAIYGEVFVLPEADIKEDIMVIPGLDGDKMSKSYGNTIEIFCDRDTLEKKVMSIVTDSKEMGEKLDPDTCNIIKFHRLFNNPNTPGLEEQYRNGEIGYGESKKQLVDVIRDYFAEARERRKHLEQNPEMVEEILADGARKANEQAEKVLLRARKRMGLGAHADI